LLESPPGFNRELEPALLFDRGIALVEAIAQAIHLSRAKMLMELKLDDGLDDGRSRVLLLSWHLWNGPAR
jgi:hypothetical protein